MGRSGGNRYQHALSIFLEIVFGRIQFQANNLPQAQLGRNTLVTSHPRLFLVRLQYFLIPTFIMRFAYDRCCTVQYRWLSSNPQALRFDETQAPCKQILALYRLLSSEEQDRCIAALITRGK
jgi:hypothetical protein